MPRIAGENDADANPAAFVGPLSVCDSGPDKVNATDAPPMGATGALVRASVVLADSRLPTIPVDGTVNAARDVLACAMITDVVANSAMTGTVAVWSAKKPAALRNDAVAVNVPALGKVTLVVATPLAAVMTGCAGIAPPKSNNSDCPATGN